MDPVDPPHPQHLRVGLTPLALLPPVATYAAVFLALWRSERWLNLDGALSRALGMTLGVFLLNMVILLLAGVLLDALFFAL